MAPASEALFDGDDTEFHAALIGLGRRGCECVQRLRRAGLADAHAFLIDHDPDAPHQTILARRRLFGAGCWAW